MNNREPMGASGTRIMVYVSSSLRFSELCVFHFEREDFEDMQNDPEIL